MSPAQNIARKPEAPEAAKRAAGEMDLAYRMQKWPRMLFRNETKEDGLLNEALGARKEGTWPAMCRELFGRLYGIGTFKLDEPQSGSEWAEELHRQADAVPEWKALCDKVQGDAWRSAIGAAQAASVLASRMPELPEENASALEAEAEMLRDLMSGGADGKQRVNQKLLEQRGELQRRIAAAREVSKSAVEKLQEHSGHAARSALREATQKAAEAIQQVDDGLEGLGCGSGSPAFERRKLAGLLANDERLRKIASLAGRLRIQAARKQRTKTTREREEILSITKGDDLEHLLASEVGLLGRADTKPFVLERIAEKRALQYELGGKATKARGPIVFCVDNSGSMGGQRDVWSKACALAMMEVARIQKRAFACFIFNTKPQHRYYFDAGEVSFDRTLEMLGVTPDGGTCIGSALDLADQTIRGKNPERDWKPGKDADVVLVTDGEDGGTDYAAFSARFKEVGASLYTIGIECQISGELAKASAEVIQVGGADMKSASVKLDGLFSI